MHLFYKYKTNNHFFSFRTPSQVESKIIGIKVSIWVVLACIVLNLMNKIWNYLLCFRYCLWKITLYFQVYVANIVNIFFYITGGKRKRYLFRLVIKSYTIKCWNISWYIIKIGFFRKKTNYYNLVNNLL